MITSSIIKHLLCDSESLSSYHGNSPVTFEDVTRRLFLLDRQENTNIPDHYYLLNKQYSLEGIGNLPDLLTKGLYRIADEYLELRNNRVYVKQVLQNEWQQLITEIPPLVLIAAFISRKSPVDLDEPEDIRRFYTTYILPNTRYTALPYPYLPQLELYVKENKGFHDLHMHLNGSTETDITWQDFLLNPDQVYNDLQAGYKDPLVREQYEQEAHLLDPNRYLKYLRIARRIRKYLYGMLYPSVWRGEDTSALDTVRKLLKSFNSDFPHSLFPDNADHPFDGLIYTGGTDDSSRLLSIEGLMYALLFNYLTLHPHECLASAFHYYLLILGLTNRFLVQQTDQYGFVQFKKITVNELRAQSEKAYKNRFFQLQGNDLRNIRFLGGRFAPKKTRYEVERLIHRIEEGWIALQKEIRKEWRAAGMEEEADLPCLNLIVHFIKAPDISPDAEIRHKHLRYKIWNQAVILSYMKKNKSPYIRNVIGVDAASSEFDAPPEVFAPVFRMLRRSGFEHFTYHAGEDFFHIVGGLRAIYEAVCFNELGCGDRIGHATATGLDVKIWRRNIGDRMLIRQGEYLDDLVFAYHLLITRSRDSRLVALKNKIPFLSHAIQELSNSIYGKYYPLKTLEDAWLLRKYCPLLMKTLSLSEQEARTHFVGECEKEDIKECSTYDYMEWSEIRKETGSFDPPAEAINLYLDYHRAYFRERYEQIMEVEVESIFTLEEMTVLQLALLEFLHEKEIVIETLPTSNVRIGHHSSFATYHLWNWLKWEEEGNRIPPIVVGTDDAGIFATNIYNEFANIYCLLTHGHEWSHSKAMEVIARLERNARIYRFM